MRVFFSSLQFWQFIEKSIYLRIKLSFKSVQFFYAKQSFLILVLGVITYPESEDSVVGEVILPHFWVRPFYVVVSSLL